MTVITSGFYVILKDQYKEEDAQHIIDAIKMIKGVYDVRIEIGEPIEYCLARSKIKSEFFEKLCEVLRKD